MYENKKILGLIPARGGSKGINRKNLCKIGGKSLLQLAIESARGSRHIDRIIVSTEDQEIAAEAKRHGCDCPFIRPAELSSDTTGSVEVALHAVNLLQNFDGLVLLQPTSPFRTSDDIDGCIEQALKECAASCASISEAPCHPFLIFEKLASGTLSPYCKTKNINTPRQSLPPAFVLNGAIYYADISWLRTSRSFVVPGITLGYPMPTSRSIDIDTPEDLEEARRILGARDLVT